MKKIILSIASIAISTFCVNAQLIRFYKGDSLVATYSQSQVDKVVFEESIALIDPSSGHEFVDLGLKDEQGRTIYWAACNIGAETPEDYGDYFAWGETETHYLGHSQDRDFYSWRVDKPGYNWATYKWGTYSSLTKYCSDSSKGVVDNKTVLDPEDDVATLTWGDNWRIPTKAERDQLRLSCTWTWDAIKQGYTVTGSNGNSIFLPAAGFFKDCDLCQVGSTGYYWSSSLDRPETYSEYACILSFNSNGLEWGIEGFMRSFGMSIRAVYTFKAEDTELIVDTLNSTFGAASESKLFNVISNVDWTVSADDESWLHFDKKSSSGNGSFAITVSENTSTESRRTTVHVGTTLSAERYSFVITQQGKGPFSGHDYVDLGLKDEQGRTIYWATCNIGAESPEDYGDYFAWGETEPYYQTGHSQDNPCFLWKKGKTGYNLKSNKWYDGTSGSMTKYGSVDGKFVLDPEDDAVTKNWGGNWRMPTMEEVKLLCNSCTWTWNSAKQGYTVIGVNGNSIFLPAAGRRSGSDIEYVTTGYYWSSTPEGGFAFNLDCKERMYTLRYFGQFVRAVCVPVE